MLREKALRNMGPLKKKALLPARDVPAKNTWQNQLASRALRSTGGWSERTGVGPEAGKERPR